MHIAHWVLLISGPIHKRSRFSCNYIVFRRGDFNTNVQHSINEPYVYIHE